MARSTVHRLPRRPTILLPALIVLAVATRAGAEPAANANFTVAAEKATTNPEIAGAAGHSGSEACRKCHAGQFRSWSSSLHAAAMRTAAAVMPAKATFGSRASAIVEFTSGKSAFTANIREKDGSETRNVPYLLGLRPLQQPLVATDRGRLQALPVAYDPAKREWFDVFDGEERRPGEFGHWTGRGMNANSQCIECHTTGFQKGYVADTDSYASRWAEPGVGCEACHGPGAGHVKNPQQPYGPFGKHAGIAAHRPKAANADANATVTTPATSRAPAASAVMEDVCAACHSVRRQIADGFVPGARLLDFYEPALLDEDLYWSDGSVRTESYEWGSFLQSRMHAAGVNCLACHDVHSGELRANGNDLCLSCHDAELAEPAHTAHEKATPASECVSCHMPESVFMARDRRRDHALAVPDPLMARDLAIPSACESCHADRGRDALAADAERLWPRLEESRFARRRAVARTFADARAGKPSSVDGLRDCVRGSTCDTPILRASAARLSANVPLDDRLAGSLLEALEDPEPLVRMGAAYALADIDPREPMLRQSLSIAAKDEVRSVRLGAAWALRTIETDRLPPEQSKPLQAAFDEWRTSTMVLADAPESWHTLGIFESARGDATAAEAAYRKAIALEPRAVPSRHNLAMLLVDTGRVDEAKAEFEALVAVDERQAPAWRALGLLHGEQGNWPEAARALGRCLTLDPAYPGVLGDLTHAYLEAGVPNVARAVLAGALEQPATRREALVGLVAVEVKAGDHDAAAIAAANLVREHPAARNDPEIARLLARADAAPRSNDAATTGGSTPSGTPDDGLH